MQSTLKASTKPHNTNEKFYITAISSTEMKAISDPHVKPIMSTFLCTSNVANHINWLYFLKTDNQIPHTPHPRDSFIQSMLPDYT